MFKIQLQNGEFFMNKSARVQHYKSEEKAKAKIEELGEIASGVTVVESKARTTTAKTEKETTSETKVVKVVKTKKAAVKSENPASSKDKTKKNKK